ncbi:expressed unknown protein [Seminavis robusta]|uniref:ELMO domain-containing protein n=1 Tax=Seminavis robusta TaxID=568900 RepID=A0A9N8DSY7_9STRA|nr:expressed unknown protein [Seminavis robusta]|eukprot:Sro348_g123300.1 n/a (473) ;mRNA; f:61435-63203
MESSPQPPNRLGELAGNAGRAFSQFATSSLQNLTTRRYTLPDKSVASQVLMYRQLLHTKCRPGLKLSRDYQGTPAQKAVLHMPWWEEGIEQTGKMIISYDNLIVRLWLNGAIMPYVQILEAVDKASIETLVDEKGLPPIPHDYWVDRLGFQQPDPVTDFRSGGVLSLAMMVHIVEACPQVHERFVAPKGDASVLPFGITCINVTDMLSKFCMLAKSVDRMDALLSQKPFWRCFADPSSILVLQELSLDMLADVVVELSEERRIPGYTAPDDDKNQSSLHNDKDEPGKVTVFDFSVIMERTEKRVERDLLGAGPKSVEELRAVRLRLKQRYRNQLERTKQRAEQQRQKQQQQQLKQQDGNNNNEGDENNNVGSTGMQDSRKMADQVMSHATNVASGATTMAAGVLAKIKSPGFNPLRKGEDGDEAAKSSQRPEEPDLMAFSGSEEDGDWVQSPMEPPTDAIEHFSIDDDDDML